MTTLLEKEFNVSGDTFYDYGTENVEDTDLFDTHKTGMSFYDDLISSPEYMQKNKNLTSHIEYITPRQYFEESAKIFGNNFNTQVNQIKADKGTIEYLKKVIRVAKKKFPLPFLDYAHNTQEGRHRMYVAGELTTWDTKFPVLIVDYYDKDLQKKIENKRTQDKLDAIVREAVRKALPYKYTAKNEFITELEYTLSNIVGKDATPDSVEFTNGDVVVKYNGGEYSFPEDELNIDPTYKPDDIDFDIPDEDIDAWLEKQGITL